MRAAIYLACLLAACGGKATVDLGGNNPRGAGWADTKPSDATPAASASASPETLYDGDFVRALAVDETTIAAAIEDSSGHHIDLCKLADCQATLQTIYEEPTVECWDSGSTFQSRFDDVLISHGEVIWAACRNDSIYLAGCPTTGCPDGPRELVHLASGAVALAASADWIYWWQREPQAKFARCPRADCEVAEIQPFPNELATLDSNRGRLLVDEPSGALYASGGAIIALVPLDFSSGPTALYQDPVGIDGLAVVGDYIYFTLSTLTGEIRRCPVTGCEDAPELVSPAPRWPTNLIADERAVYWIHEAETNFISRNATIDLVISSYPLDGTRSDAVDLARTGNLAGNHISPVLEKASGLVMNSHHLYWWEPGSKTDIRKSLIRMVAR